MSRITARTAAMQLIYEKLSGGQGGEESLQMVYEELRKDGVPGVDKVGMREPNEADREYIMRVLEGVIRDRSVLDEKIEKTARGWALDRMPLIDLIIMRVAVWEMLYEKEVPEMYRLRKRWS